MAENKGIHNGHRKRMRERFEHGGFYNYQPHEVLEQLLFESITRGNTNEIAHMLIEKCGSLEEVFHAPKEKLMEVKGIGERSAELIMSVYHEIGRMMLKQYKEADEITIYEIVVLMDWFIKQCHDTRVYAMIFNARRQLIDYIPIEPEIMKNPAEVAELISSRENTSIFYLTADNKNKVELNLINDIGKLTEQRGCYLSDAFYLTMLGFSSVKNPENMLDIYKIKAAKNKHIKITLK